MPGFSNASPGRFCFFYWTNILKFPILITHPTLSSAPVVQWIEHSPPKAEIEVRFLAGAKENVCLNP